MEQGRQVIDRRAEGCVVARQPWAVDRRAAWCAALLALVVLAAVPAVATAHTVPAAFGAAKARTIAVDGRVTGRPTVRGSAVTVPVQLSKRARRALKLRTRIVRVRLRRRARLAMSGAGAGGASWLAPRALRTNDRLKGVTVLSPREQRRLRRRARPLVRLRRVSVTRPARRGSTAPAGGGAASGAPGTSPGAPGTPPGAPGTRPAPPSAPAPRPPRSFEQIVADLQSQTATLDARVGAFGSLPAKVETQALQAELLGLGLEPVVVAFESLGAALEAREGPVEDPALEAALIHVELVGLRVEGLEDRFGAFETALGQLEGGVSKLGGAMSKLVPTVSQIAAQVRVINQTAGAQAQVVALEDATWRALWALDVAEWALDAFQLDSGTLSNRMASLAGRIEGLANAALGGANLNDVIAGVNALGADIAGLESGFDALATTVNRLAPVAAGLEGDAVAIEDTVGSVCSLVPTTCP